MADRTRELMDRLLVDRDQVAELLGTRVGTVDYLHRVGKLPAVKVGRDLHWKPEAVKTFVDGLQDDA